MPSNRSFIVLIVVHDKWKTQFYYLVYLPCQSSRTDYYYCCRSDKQNCMWVYTHYYYCKNTFVFQISYDNLVNVGPIKIDINWPWTLFFSHNCEKVVVIVVRWFNLYSRIWHSFQSETNPKNASLIRIQDTGFVAFMSRFIYLIRKLFSWWFLRFSIGKTIFILDSSSYLVSNRENTV